MFRFLLIALLFYLIFIVIRGLVGSGPKRDPDDVRELVRDAHTGVYFSKSKAVTVTRDGETLHFSSIENRDAWLRRRDGLT